VERTQQRGLDRPRSEFRRGEYYGPGRDRGQYVASANWYGYAGGRDAAGDSGGSRRASANTGAHPDTHADTHPDTDASAYSGSDASTDPNASALHVWCLAGSDRDRCGRRTAVHHCDFSARLRLECDQRSELG
jgi:hypothetical protein